MKRALACISFIAAYLAYCASASAADPRAMQLTYNPWIKYCISTSCFISVEARGQCHPSGGAVTVALLDNKSARLSAHFGARRALDGVISAQIDQDTPIILSDQRCYTSGCDGQTTIDSGFVERLKQSQTMTIETTDTAHQKIRLSFSLADFAKAYAGPGAEPKVFEESQEKLKEVLQLRAEKDQPRPQCED